MSERIDLLERGRVELRCGTMSGAVAFLERRFVAVLTTVWEGI